MIWKSAVQQGYPHGTVVQLLILTGQRRTEIANLRRAWINAEERTITLPDWITKNGKDHTFPYGDFVAAILESVPGSNRTDLLFLCRISGERPLSGWSKFKKELNDGVCRLDAPRFAPHLSDQPSQRLRTFLLIGERLINHLSAVATDVEQIYDVWTYLPEMRAAVEKHERHVLAVLGTEDTGRKSAA